MEKVFVTGHAVPDTDSVCSAIAYAEFRKMKGDANIVPARLGGINPETEFALKRFSVKPPVLLEGAEGKKLILVDHNEFSQSAKGIEKAGIIEVIDHHKVKFSCGEPIRFLVEPVGSTATIVSEMFSGEGIAPEKGIAGILLSAVLSDTVIFRSPTTTERDRKAAIKLAGICGIKDVEAFGMELKKAKSSLKGMSAREIVMSDFKDFDYDNGKVGVGQIEIVDNAEVDKIEEELAAELKKLCSEKGYSVAALMATNIIEKGTKLLVAGDIRKVEKAFGKKAENNSVYLKGVMSRKKDVAPFIEKVFG